MNSIQRIKRFGWGLLRPVALQALRHTGTFDVTWRSVRKLRERGMQVRVAIDGGAAVGDWAGKFKTIYPDAQVLCIEPRDEPQEELARLAGRVPGIHVAQTLVGEAETEVAFHVHKDQSSILKNASGSDFGETKQMPMTTLDALIKQRNLSWPDLIKLDLQGAELQCLRGAPECLKHAQAVLLEVLVLPLYKDAPRLADLVGYMAEQGFITYDICSLWHRPLDGALAYGDFVFVRADSPLIADGRWSRDAPWEAIR